MEYTNNHRFNDIIKSWLLNDEYDYHPNTISATGLMKPIRATILRERHDADMKMDIADLVAMRYGTAIHSSFEATDLGPDILQEKRLFKELNGFTISGKFDMLRNDRDGSHTLMDIKSTSVWNYIYKNKVEEYTTQLSIYRYLLQAEYKVKDGAEIIMVFTDWAKTKARQDPDYPQTRLMVMKLDLWDIKATEDYIKERLSIIKDSRNMADDDLPLCTEEELWKKDDKYAVMKKGRKSAVRVFDNEDEAMQLRNTLDDGYVEVRKGHVNRCPDYCACHPFCNQHKKLIEDGYILD